MKHLLIHVPHASMYIPEAYRRSALIPQEELEEENRFMCDTGILELIPPTLYGNAVIFPYSRLYCDVERFRDGSEPMEAYGMGYMYTRDSKGRPVPLTSGRCRMARQEGRQGMPDLPISDRCQAACGQVEKFAGTSSFFDSR